MRLESRWLRMVAPGIFAAGAVAAVAATALGGSGRWVPGACPGEVAAGVASIPAGPPTNAGRLGAVGVPDFRLDPILDAQGALAGQRLSVGRGDVAFRGTLDLPPESFAAGPFGGVILVGSDDGTTSHLQAIDLDSGCAWSIADEASVIRRATIDARGVWVYETRVDRVRRIDLGVWRRALDGTDAPRRILAPLGTDERFGRTFSTEFTWETAGPRLAIQACGEIACRTRLLDPRGDPGTTVDAPDLGPIIGFGGDRLVTYAACRGLPCPIVSTDLNTMRRDVLARDAGAATVLETPTGPRLVHEVLSTTGRRLRAVALDGLGGTDLGALPDGLRLQTTPGGEGDAPSAPTDRVVLAPDDPTSTDPSVRPQLRHLPDGSSVPFNEVVR